MSDLHRTALPVGNPVAALLLIAICAQFAHGATAAVTVDPVKELPRYPAIEPPNAVATWQIKKGFKLELAAHEPQVRSPVAIAFDEHGRLFVCEMIDYSERRSVTPHLGRISMLEDKDGDGVYETSSVFADDLPWPTGLIWANGGLFVIAVPDILFFKDTHNTGRADVREVVYTGFGSAMKTLNVQGLANCPQWGQDNRIHIQSGPSGAGKIKCVKRPELNEIDVRGHDFWFDPRTFEFGREAGGGQYGMSFDNFGRKFACGNSDHLQYFVYDERYAGRNPFFHLPAARQSIAADGGAAEVYRISPDEPWRIVRTRWRVAGVVQGMVEGGGRVSGYFTGATGTTVYRGDAYGAEFLNNTFTGDAGGQLVHRKRIFADGASLIGKRPDDEQNFEFAASKDTWVRVVNFANAPDGCLYVVDMYREVIEHPWSIPEEIKKHLDLNSGNERGRIYRIVPERADWKRRSAVDLAAAGTDTLVKTLEHPNGWHRDTAARLLYEHQDNAAIPLLRKLFRETPNPLARLLVLSALAGCGALDEEALLSALADGDARVRERGVLLSEALTQNERLRSALAVRADDPDVRVRFQLAFTLETLLQFNPGEPVLQSALAKLATKDYGDRWISAALLSGPPEIVNVLFDPLTQDPVRARQAAAFVAKMIEMRAASKVTDAKALIDFITAGEINPLWLRALGEGLRQAGTTLEKADREKKLAAVFAQAAATAPDHKAANSARLAAIELLHFAPPKQSCAALVACLGAGEDEIQAAAIKSLMRIPSADSTQSVLSHWPAFGKSAKETALTLGLQREDGALALLAAIQSGMIKPDELSASQIQSLTRHKETKVADLAKVVLAALIPPSRAETLAKFNSAVALKGDATSGQKLYAARCMACHRAAGQGTQVGPDLVTVKTKGREALLLAIIDPNKEVAAQYILYTIKTKDGLTLSGLIVKDDATSITLRMSGGIEQTIPRNQIKATASSGQSLMPEGLEAGLDLQQLADLLTFIEELH